MMLFFNKNKPLPFDWGTATSVGRVRNLNEDSFLAQPPLFAVADGMGGHEGGEIASAIAVETLVKEAPDEISPEGIAHAIERANHAIIDAVEKGEGNPGMGTTLTAVYINDDQAFIGHVGDSRIYLYSEGKLVRVTHDHSYVEELIQSGEITDEEARSHPQRSVITRALGSDPDMKADHLKITIANDDRLLVCSDGLTTMLTDEQIADIMGSYPTPQETADQLVEAANIAGGQDNVTAIVIEINNDGTSRKQASTAFKTIIAWFVAVLTIVGITSFSLYVYAQNSWYLQDLDGHVALYNGLPGDFGPFDFSELENKTNIDIEKLPNSTAKRLQEGVVVGSREEAESIIQSYRENIEQAAIDAAKEAAEAEDARKEAEKAAAEEESQAPSFNDTQPETQTPATSGAGA